MPNGLGDEYKKDRDMYKARKKRESLIHAKRCRPCRILFPAGKIGESLPWSKCSSAPFGEVTRTGVCHPATYSQTHQTLAHNTRKHRTPNLRRTACRVVDPISLARKVCNELAIRRVSSWCTPSTLCVALTGARSNATNALLMMVTFYRGQFYTFKAKQ